MRKSGFPEVNLVVNHAGHQEAAGCIDDVEPALGCNRLIDLRNPVALDENIRIADFALIDQARIFDQQLVQRREPFVDCFDYSNRIGRSEYARVPTQMRMSCYRVALGTSTILPARAMALSRCATLTIVSSKASRLSRTLRSVSPSS